MTPSPGRPALRYITQAFAYLRGVLQPPGTVVSKVEISHPPLFESEPPTAFRYAIPLAISYGTFIIGACDLAVTHWARLEKPSPERPAESPSSNSPANITLTSPATEPEESIWVVRPLWQRATLAGTYLAVSLYFGVMFFGSRARYIHRLHIIYPPVPSQGTGSAKQRSLFFQTCDNSGMHGRVVPFRQCKMKLAATDRTQVFLEVNGTPAPFRIGTAGAKINGKETPPSRVFTELAKCGILLS